MHIQKILIISVISLAMAACVNVKAPVTNTHFSWQSPALRQAQLALQTHWQKQGAFSITIPNQSPIIANFNWDNISSNTYHLVVSSALNVYRLDIMRDANGMVTLRKNGLLIARAGTPEELMQAAVGWSLPIDALQEWIKGMPTAYHQPSIVLDDYGHIVQLKQLGWVIGYADYATDHAGVDFPQAITLQRPGFFAKIVVKRDVS